MATIRLENLIDLQLAIFRSEAKVQGQSHHLHELHPTDYLYIYIILMEMSIKPRFFKTTNLLKNIGV